jgi:hypothetical protein
VRLLQVRFCGFFIPASCRFFYGLYLRGRYNGGKFRHVLIDAALCAFIVWFIRCV